MACVIRVALAPSHGLRVHTAGAGASRRGRTEPVGARQRAVGRKAVRLFPGLPSVWYGKGRTWHLWTLCGVYCLIVGSNLILGGLRP
jgi:hypothetical protein